MGRTAFVVTQKCHLSCFCCCFCALGAAAPSCGQVKARKVARLTSIPRRSIFLALHCGTCIADTVEQRYRVDCFGVKLDLFFLKKRLGLKNVDWRIQSGNLAPLVRGWVGVRTWQSINVFVLNIFF